MTQAFYVLLKAHSITKTVYAESFQIDDGVLRFFSSDGLCAVVAAGEWITVETDRTAVAQAEAILEETK